MALLGKCNRHAETTTPINLGKRLSAGICQRDVWQGETKITVDELHREAFRATWDVLARRNSWALAENDAEFLDRAIAEFATLTSGGSVSGRIRLALERTYSAVLYAALQRKEERAAQELWLAFWRLALKNGWSRDEANEIAQEAVFRAYARLSQLQTPQGLLYWALGIFRWVQRDLRARDTRDTPLENDAGEAQHDIASDDDVAATVERRVMIEEIDALLREHVAIQRQRETLIRHIIFGEELRDIARDQGVPLHRARQDKFRALERLRNNEDVMQRLRDLAGDSNATNSE